MLKFLLRFAPILLLLAAMGAVYALTLGSFGMFGWDEAEYAGLARSLLRLEGFAIGGHPNHYRLPVLPAASALSMLAFGSSADWVAKLPVLAFSLAALCVVYAAARIAYDALTGWLAAGFLGLFPMFWLYTAHLLTEMPFMVFFSAALFSLYFSMYRDRRWLPAFAFFAALALLTRYTAVLLGPLALGFFGFFLLRRPREALPFLCSRVFALSLSMGAFMLLPWLVRQHLVFGDAIAGFRYAATQLDWYRPEVSMPWYFYLSKMPWMLTPAGCALAAAGALWAVGKRDRFALHCAFAVAGVIIWHSFYRYKEPRLVMAVLPLAAVLAAAVAARTLTGRSRRLRIGTAAGLLALTAGVSGYLVLPILKSQVTSGYPSFLSAMQHLRRVSAADGVVLGAALPQIAWYADRRVDPYPPEEALHEMSERAQWAVVTDFEPGQAPYVMELYRQLPREAFERGDAFSFRDRRFFTALVKTGVLSQAAARKGP